jgi:hypothetical protein
VGAEEMDWLAASAARLFDRGVILSDGAGALYLRCRPLQEGNVFLSAITHPHLFTQRQSRVQAAQRARAELGPIPGDGLLCDGLQGARRSDRDEAAVWQDWAGPRVSPKRILGEGLMAAAAWQCLAAVDSLASNGCFAATVSVLGCNQQAIAAQFGRACRSPTPGPQEAQHARLDLSG